MIILILKDTSTSKRRIRIVGKKFGGPFYFGAVPNPHLPGLPQLKISRSECSSVCRTV